MTSESEFEVAIVGGGLVGLVLALGLRTAGRRVALIDRQPFLTVDPSDYRSLALSFSSVAFLKTLADGQVWAAVEPSSAPLHHIHISEAGTTSLLRLHAAEFGSDPFGAVVPIAALYPALSEAVQQVEPTLFSGEAVKSVDSESGTLTLASGRTLTASVILACDGGQSFIRTQLGLPTDRHDYHQSALVTSVQLERTHGNTAFERFLPDGGVLAVLPLGEARRVGVVWAQATEKTQAALALSEAELRAALQKNFGQRLGAFQSVGPRHTYPLQKVMARTCFKGRVLLMGNAAHQLNPVGAQGLNLALRDIAVWLKIVEHLGERLGSSASTLAECLFEPYVAQRAPDHARLEHVTHGMAVLYQSSDCLSALTRRGMMAALRGSRYAREQLVLTLTGKRDYYRMQESIDAV